MSLIRTCRSCPGQSRTRTYSVDVAAGRTYHYPRTSWLRNPQGDSMPAKGALAPRRGVMKWLLDWAKSIAVAVAIWLVLRTFVVEAFRIPSASLENTLLLGDFLFVTKALYGP